MKAKTNAFRQTNAEVYRLESALERELGSSQMDLVKEKIKYLKEGNMRASYRISEHLNSELGSSELDLVDSFITRMLKQAN